MTSGRGATITWTSVNYPASIVNGSNTSTFSYTPDRQYWRQVSNYASGGTATTIYVGGILEKVTTSAGTDFRHMIRAGGSTIIVSRQSTGTNSVHYVTSDHLGSSSAVTNASGGMLVNSSFDAFGKRRGSNWSGSPSSGDWAAIAGTTRRGYTDHTMLDNLGLIHMNGRVQDPSIGRFTSSDPFIPDPFNTQSYNRFSYVRNNPLTRLDLNGFNDCTVDPNAITGRWFVEQETITVNRYNAAGQLLSSTRQNGSVTANFWATSVPLVCRPGPWNDGYTAPGDGPKGDDTRSSEAEGDAKPHHYEIRIPNRCSPDEGFEAVKADFTAPGAPAAQEGTTPRMLHGVIPFLSFLPFDLTHRNPIDQVVHTPSRRLLNVASEGHIFYPGTVDTVVFPHEMGSLVSTVGTGTGEYPTLNNVLGTAYFGVRGTLLALGCEARHGNPLDGPMYDLR